MKYIGICNKSQQAIMHSILQEYLYHFDFVCVNIDMDKYNVRVINSNDVNNKSFGSQKKSQVFYPNLFNVYANHDETQS